MKKNNLKRYLASLLAVLMLISVTGISPAVFAEDETTPPVEETVTPQLKENSGEVLIKSSMTNDEVSELLSKALISNYDELDDTAKAALQWEYLGYGYTENFGAKSVDEHWGSINGGTKFTEKHGITYTYYNKALSGLDDGSYQVRLAGTTAEATLVKVSKYSTSLVLKENASITYNMDAAAEKEAIVANVIDYSASVLPEGTTAADFKVELKTGLFYKEVPNAKLDAGEGQTIRISYNGNDTYKASGNVTAAIDVAKATVNVSVTPVSKIYAGEEIVRSSFYSLDPNDPELDVYIFFVGVNSNLETCVNIKLSEAQEKLIDAISSAQEKWYALKHDTESLTLKQKLQEGITLGQLKEIINGIITNDSLMKILETFGYDVESLKNIVAALDVLTDISDDTTVAIGTPAHAGVYVATVVAVGKNYETGKGTGSLVVLKNWKGIKLEKNSILGDNNTITVSDAKQLGKDNNLCILTKSGDALDSTSVGSIRYWFTGVNRIYAKSTMPTAPGKYIVTATVRGGDFFAMPKTFVFTIVADTETTPEA